MSDMGNPEETSPKSAKLKIVIIILAVLLVLSAGGLAGRYIYLHFAAPTQTTATVPDNLIGEDEGDVSGETSDTSEGEESAPSSDDDGAAPPAGDGSGSGNGSSAEEKPSAPVLELYEGRPDANRKFEVSNMLPGDSETGYFCVKAHHDADITLFFKADVTEQTKSLGNVLHIRVTHLDSGKVLCDAPFAEIDGKEFSELLTANAQKETTAYYQIDVSLDTSVGNEYQAALLKADFEWYVKDEGGLTPPQTGDSFNIILWVVLAASTLVLILLLAFRRRKEAR